MAYDYDLIVIGAGSGGVRAARMSALAGAKVAIVEEYRYGGTCVIRGCVPKKLMVYASAFAESFEDAKGYGWTVGESRFSWPDFMAAKDREIARLEGIYARNLGAAGVELHRARGVVTGPHSVRLSSHDKDLTAKHILVATGGAPFVPDVPGACHAMTSNEVFELPEMPKRIVIVGGGYIACEFAGVLNGMGAKVVQLYRGERILRGFDGEVAGFVQAEMIKKGVEIRVESDVAAIGDPTESGLAVELTSGETIETDAVLYATGRHPNARGIGLEEAGVKLGAKGEVVVDEYSRTSVPSIWAIGDVTDRVALTPVAIREGAAFAKSVFEGELTAADHELIPTAVFTQPEIGTCGMTEEAARETHDIEVYAADFRPMMHTMSGRDERMLMKLLVDKATRKVLGCHLVGHGAGEMIQLAGIALKMGATKEDFDRTVAVHPTAAEELVTMKTPTR
ncbi:glutathione-disulfide reductase [Albimonas pacifica]|uniref:Glutathione reductase n=1 Tax=Albimonas pacifica TaxID=1114924 RepID=A0A1I3GJK9_9RHOB|nr:glutathione-disulfide reductase [Albimonas pacifica]SFI23644.1 NADPH-glutathione reductase [Albimonas pacifica]